MRSTVMAAVVAGVFAASAAGAAPTSLCDVLTDPSADVTVAGVVPVPQEEHLDVRAVGVGATRSALLVRITDTDLVERRLGEWRLTFTAGRARLFVGAGTGMWVNVGSYRGTFGFYAGIDGGRAVPVRGTFDLARDEIRVTVPFTAFPGAAVRRGDVLTSFAIEAKESLANVAPEGPASAQVPLVDLGSSSRRYAIGRTC